MQTLKGILVPESADFETVDFEGIWNAIAEGAINIATALGQSESTPDSGAIVTVPAGVVALTAPSTSGSASSGYYELNDPEVVFNGAELVIISKTAVAHIVSSSATGINDSGSKNFMTFGGAKGDNIVLRAYDSKWWKVKSTNVTIT